MIGEIRAIVNVEFDRTASTLNVWYNPQLDEDVLVVRTHTGAGVRWNLRTEKAVRVYDPRVLPLTNDTIQGIYRCHLADRHTVAP
jgi:hypothetical protein